MDRAQPSSGLEELDGVARWVFEHGLLAALAGDDLAAEARPRLAQGLELLGEVVDLQLPGERQGVDRTTMVAVVDDLERTGLVERRRYPHDRRAYSLHATAKGRRLLRQASEAEKRAEDEFLAPLPAGDRRRLKQMLQRLILQ